MIIVKRIWTKVKLEGIDPQTFWERPTHKMTGYFLFGIIPLYLIKEKIN